MASSPSPCFFPTTVPTYVPTTVFPPPPFGFGAPAYGYPASPFPYAASYPYPPPASAYMPVSSGFSSNLPTWPPPAPDPTPYTATYPPPNFPGGDNTSPFPIYSAPPTFPYAAASPIPASGFSPDPAYASTTIFVGTPASGPLSAPAYVPSAVPPDPTREELQSPISRPSDPTPLTPTSTTCAGYSTFPSVTNVSSPGSTTTAASATARFSTTARSANSTPTIATTAPAAPACVASQVFSEMPAPRPGYENCCSGHPNPIQSSRVQGGSTNLSEQNFDGIPECYGLHSLERRSLFRADGTEHSYFTLPTDYPLERAAPEPVFTVYDNKSDGCSAESVHVFTGTTEQLTDEEEQYENRQASKCFIKSIFSPERPTVGTVDVFILTGEKKPDNERTVVYVNKAFDNAFCEDVTSTHVPYVFVDVSIKCSMRNSKIKLPSLTDSELCGKHRKSEHGNNQQVNMLMTEMRRKEWDPGILDEVDMMLVLSASCRDSTENRLANQELVANISCKVAALTWHSSITGTQFLLLNITNYTWDPGVLKFKDITLDKYAVPCQVQSVQQITELSFFTSEAGIQHYAQDGVKPVLHGTSLVLQRATHSSQVNYICSLYYKAEYCQMRCLWDFSISSRKRVQWDPRVKMYLHSRLDLFTIWSAIDKPLSCTHIPDLAVWPSQSAGRSASYIWDPGTMLLGYRSIWLFMFTEEKEMGRLIPEQWRLWFKVMHYRQISQKCEAMSSQLDWHEDIKFIGIAPWLISFNPP